MRLHSRRTWAAPVTGLVLAAALTGCSQSTGSEADSGSDSDTFFNIDDCTDPNAATEEITGDIKIGYSLPLSGPVAGVVELSQAGYEARVNAFNEAGGVDGQMVEIVTKDDAFAPDKAKANVVDFIQNDGVAAVTTFGSGQVAAMADDQNAACVPMLYPSATNPDYYNIEEYPWLVQFLPRADREAAFNVAAIQQQMGDEEFTLGIAANETASGQTNAKNFALAAEEAGLEVAIEVPDTDPTAAATQLKSAGVDVVFHAGLTGTCAALNSSMARIGYEPKLVVMVSSCVNAAEFAAAGAAAEGSQLPLFSKNPLDPGADSDEGVQQYLEETADVATADNSITVAGWLMADMLVHTLTQAAESEDGLTRAGLIEAARDMEYVSPMLVEGASWSSTPDALVGVTGFDIGEWDGKVGSFVPQGSYIEVS